MQGLHQHQQQLAALLSAATGDEGEPSRLAAITSLHRAVVYPPNSVLVTHSASFLAQGFYQLLSDKSYPVRQAAATAYGALCSVLCSILLSLNGRQNHVLGGLVDRFINWALPLLRNIRTGDGATDLALQALREFLNVGDVGAIEGYALPILKASKELLEDERTSLSLLHQLLGVLTLISLKFFGFFQPHFVDIVDLLLGWVMVPDLADSDRRVIMDSFLQFQKHWVTGLPFSLGLLSKFLGDMDVQLKVGSAATPQQFQRLLALLSCFCTVLQSTASGLLEMNLLEQIIQPLSQMIPLLLGCITMVGRKFGWSKWITDSWRCLTLLAEILSDRFSNLYPLAVDVLFQSLEMGNNEVPGMITSFHVHGVIKTNLQLLSLQKHGLLASSVYKILQLSSPISKLRLHPNHLVTASSAATYIFLLQHRNNEVVEQAVDSLMEEVGFLMGMLERILVNEVEVGDAVGFKSYSKSELSAMIKFDLKVLLSCISVGRDTALVAGSAFDALYLKRSERLASFIMEKLDPFSSTIQNFVELQTSVMKALGHVSLFEVFKKCSIRKQKNKVKSENVTIEAQGIYDNSEDHLPFIIFNHLKKYIVLLTKGLHVSSPLAVKLQAFSWIYQFCQGVIDAYEDTDEANDPFKAFGFVTIVGHLVTSILNAALDREPKVRYRAVSVLELLLQAKIVHPPHFYAISVLVLEKLGDPDDSIRNAFMKILSQVLPITIYTCGLHDRGKISTCRMNVLSESSNLHWWQVFALKQVSQQLHSQQLVSILSFLSQRWKVPLSSWIQRLIHTCRSSKHVLVNQLEEVEDSDIKGLGLDFKFDEDILERVSTVNILAGAWWAINEAARYCITTRLRTNLGGPTQTFAALERMLLDVAHVLQLDTEQSDGSSHAHLLPMRLLLDFVEVLKKNVYNAYEGSTVLPCATRQSTLFFRANRKVCEEWFSRICEPMMNAGLALQCHHATIHYCTLRLQELKNLAVSSRKDNPRGQVNTRLKNSEDMLRVIRHMALSLCKVHEPDALIGLRKWAMTFYSLLTDENHNVRGDEDLGPFAWITGLVHQAEGQHEMAAAHFTHLLQEEESLSLMGSDGVQFVIARVIESYAAISDWKSLDSWLLDLQTLRAKHSGKRYSGALTAAGNEINAIHALARFDEGDYQAAWSFLDLTPKSSKELTLDPKLALQRSEQMLLQALLLHTEGKVDRVRQEIQKAKSMLDEALSVLPMDGLDEAAAHSTQLHCIFAFEESFKTEGSRGKQSQSLLSSYIQVFQSPINEVHQDCNMWLKVLRVHRSIFPASPVNLKLSKNLISLARKQGNLVLAHRLSNHLRDLVTSYSEGRYRDFLTRSLQYESILLMHAENKLEDAVSNIWSFLRPCFISSSSIISNPQENFLNAKACLKLSHWLRNYSTANVENIVRNLLSDFNTSNASSFGGVAASPNDDNLCSKPNVVVLVEELVGTTTKLSSQLCPSLGKSWVSYASWCYSQAKASMFAPIETTLQSISFSSILGPELVPDRFKLSEEEMLKVTSVVLQLLQSKTVSQDLNIESTESKVLEESPDDTRSENLEKALVQQVVGIIETAAGASGVENSSGESLSSLVTSQLLKCFQSNVIVDNSSLVSSVGELVDIWWAFRRRRVSLFGHAAQAFIKYLSFSSSMHPDGDLAASFCEFLNKKTVSYTHRATLYVLDILLNYGVELKETLEPALSIAPLLPWQEITPQIFARVSAHPEQVVRKLLEGLLLMIAKSSPWSIVYPTLVDVNSSQEQPSEELQQILACLSKLYPRLIQDVQLVIKELENVTVLWEELWLSTLQDLHSDVMRRINLLKEEALRVEENATLTHSEKNRINAAKYTAMMAPIIVALERRLASTSQKPETPHEIWFHDEYMEQIKTSITKFRTPPASALAIGDVWRPFSNIATSLASYQRKASISLVEVAPLLAQLSSSDVPMPGLERQIMMAESDGGFTSSDEIVTIASFAEQVSILPTKTKPKKLVILGSDGQKYRYLLKGREDLRLDARIMQLLQVINGTLHSSQETRKKSLSIRYYSVTPISGRAGLIQWVDNVTSIYSIFKSWQSRAQIAQFQASGAGNTKNSVPLPVPRPSDMFYGKIIPALKEKGIRKVISRRDWPHEVKRKVFLDLMNEVPEQLLHQELWCASEGFKAFNSKLKRFSGSVATMSMVGHILGLGDRHLDNILIDFSSGDILHIDYNVCFDKGQRLKIPEIVPFRLTQTIEAALGLTGIDGIFRANCEAVLGVLKKNKDMVLMLLEVFAWDPLVEWTRGDFPDDAAIVGEERKGMEVAVSLSLFASRVQEIRVPLQEHHDLLLGNLPSVESALESFACILDQYEPVSSVFHHADQEMSNLVLHETSAKSMVAEATINLEKFGASFETQAREFAQAKALVADKAQVVTNWMEEHGRLLDTLRSSSIPELKTYLQLKGMDEAFSLTSAVVVAGVPLTVVPEPTQAQCHDIDTEVSQLIVELDHGLNSAVQALQSYSLALQRILPQNYLTTSPMHGWAQVLQLSVNTPTSDVLSFALRQAAELIAEVHKDKDEFDTRRGSYNSLYIKVEKYAEEIDKLEREHAELVNSIGLENETLAKDRLLSALVKYLESHGLEDKEEKVVLVLNVAFSSFYGAVKQKMLEILSHFSGARGTLYMLQSDVGATFSEFEEQIEKCVLVAGFLKELQQNISGDSSSSTIDSDSSNYISPTNWASIFRNILLSCKNSAGQMIEVVLPDVLSSIVSFSSEVMDAFGSISQVKRSIDTALEQLVEVELERASLIELEQNYFVKVGLVTEKQLALEEAAMKGRDHLSWEEAEELASQEEACRDELDEIHQTWHKKDVRSSSLLKRESSIRSVLLSSESHFQSLISAEKEIETRDARKKSLLVALDKPFSELESMDSELSSIGGPDVSSALRIPGLQDLISSGYPISGFTWKFSNLMNKHSFFIWKVGIMSSLVESCIHDAALSVDQNLGFDQLLNVVKKKVEIHLGEQLCHYLKERVGPNLLAGLDKEIEYLKKRKDTVNEPTYDQQNKDLASVRRIQHMLEEYCNSHETVRAARSAASLMKRQVNELKEVLCKTSLEVFAMEWMHDVPLNPLHNVRLISHKFFGSEDNLISVILNLNRAQLLDTMRSSVAKVIGALKGLKACERTSVTAEGKLERAMGWACGGPNSSGIPAEFHNHLMRRRQLLLETHGKASDLINMCMSMLEFEASRDGLLLTSTEVYSFRAGADGRAWHQDYLNVLTRLDVAHHSLTRTEQDLKLAQSTLEATSNILFSLTNELSIASERAKSASDDLQNTLLAMRDCAYETSVALSAFALVSRSHTALTSESGSMLEEVLAITESLHDIHSMGKEAAAVHFSLMKDLSKANEVLLPLESVLSEDVTAMTDAIEREKETKMLISPIHGQAIYQSYYSRIKEAIQGFKPLVPSLTVSVKGLHSLLTMLARAASLHAGNLHKALEGLGESQVVGSQDSNLSRPIVAAHDSDYDIKEEDVLSRNDTESQEDIVGVGALSIQDKGWISPPDSISDSSSESSSTSADLNSGDNNYPENEQTGPNAGLNSEKISLNEQSELKDLETGSGDTADIYSVGEYVKPEESQQDMGLPSVVETSKSLNPESSHVQVGLKDDSMPLSQDKGDSKDHGNPDCSTDVGIRLFRGKNPYAMSVLKRVEMKIDGRGISENRAINVAEQVDFLLKQATSVDNLCNMYEGWTPWI